MTPWILHDSQSLLNLTESNNLVIVNSGSFFTCLKFTRNSSKRQLREKKFYKRNVVISADYSFYSLHTIPQPRRKYFPKESQTDMGILSSSLMSIFSKPISCFKKWEKEKKSSCWFEIMCGILSFRNENIFSSFKDSLPNLCSILTGRAQSLDIASFGNIVLLGEVTRYCKCSIGVLFLSLQ